MRFRWDQTYTAERGLLVLSHPEAAKFVPDPKQRDIILIRITDTEGRFKPLKSPSSYKDILCLKFDDVEQDSHSFKAITQQDAEKIADFLIKYKGMNLVVHCEAGISRSSGVGFCWAELNRDERVQRILVDSTGWYKPNYVVVAEVRRALKARLGEDYGMGS